MKCATCGMELWSDGACPIMCVKTKNKVEVFIAFTKNSNIHELQRTMEAWDTDEYEPVGIQVQAHKFDILRIVAAEGMAKADYIIADLGSRPSDPKGWQKYAKGSMKVEEMQQWPSQDSPS